MLRGKKKKLSSRFRSKFTVFYPFYASICIHKKCIHSQVSWKSLTHNLNLVLLHQTQVCECDMVGLDSHDMHESVYNLSFQVTVQWTSLRWPGGTACPPSPSPPWTRPSSLCWRWPLSWAPRSSTTEVRRTGVILFIVPSEGRVWLNLFHNSTSIFCGFYPPHTFLSPFLRARLSVEESHRFLIRS